MVSVLKRALLSLAALIASTVVSYADCTGQFASGWICDNSTASQKVPTGGPVTTLFDRIYGSTAGTIIYRGPSGWTSLPGNSSGTRVLQENSSGVPSWAAAAGTGTVVSVGLSLPDIFTVSGSPVTTSGTLTAVLASQGQNLVLASPSGVGGTPTFRQLAIGDLPPAATNTVIGNATSGSAPAIALSVPSCSTASSALTWTTNTGFGCNSITTPLGPIAADNILGNASGSSAVPAAVPLTSCSASQNALTYNTTTHAFGCNTISGSGTVLTGAIGQIGWYSSITNVIGGNPNATIANGALTLGVASTTIGQLILEGSSSGAVTITPQAAAGTPTVTWGTASGTPAVTASSPLAIASATGNITVTGVAGQVLGGAGPAFTATPTLGAAGVATGQVKLAGTTSGTITLTVVDAAGTWTMKLPTSGGAPGQFLETDGSGVTSWVNPAGGGTVSSGLLGQLAYYGANGTTVSGNANANISAGALTLGQTGSSIGSIVLAGNTSGAVTLIPLAAAGTWSMTLPNSGGSNGQFLSTNGSGTTSWTSALTSFNGRTAAAVVPGNSDYAAQNIAFTEGGAGAQATTVDAQLKTMPIDVRNYGATCTTVIGADGATTSGSTAFTDIVLSFTANDVNRAIWIQATHTVTFTGSGVAVVNWTNHGLAVNTPVVFSNSGGALPPEMAANPVGTYYYVSADNLLTNSFQIKPYPTGSNFVITTTGTGTQTAIADRLFKTTIAAVGGAHSITLAATAPGTYSGATFWYSQGVSPISAADDTTGVQAAVTAVAAGLATPAQIHLPYGCMINSAITVGASMEIFGDGPIANTIFLGGNQAFLITTNGVSIHDTQIYNTVSPWPYNTDATVKVDSGSSEQIQIRLYRNRIINTYIAFQSPRWFDFQIFDNEVDNIIGTGSSGIDTANVFQVDSGAGNIYGNTFAGLLAQSCILWKSGGGERVANNSCVSDPRSLSTDHGVTFGFLGYLTNGAGTSQLLFSNNAYDGIGYGYVFQRAAGATTGGIETITITGGSCHQLQYTCVWSLTSATPPLVTNLSVVGIGYVGANSALAKFVDIDSVTGFIASGNTITSNHAATIAYSVGTTVSGCTLGPNNKNGTFTADVLSSICGGPSGPWQAFALSPSCGTGTFSVTSATYKTVDKTTFIQADFTLTAVGTCSNVMAIALPNTSSGSMSFALRDYGVSGKSAICANNTSAASAVCNLADVSAFATNARLVGTGVYTNQ